MTTAKTTIAVQCEWIKIIPIFLSDWQKIYFLVWHKILVISLHVPGDEKGWKSLEYTDIELLCVHLKFMLLMLPKKLIN